MFVRNLKTLLEGKKRILEKRSLGMYCKASDWTCLDEIDEKANIDCRRRVSVKALIREQLVRNSLSKEYILVSKDDYERRKDRETENSGMDEITERLGKEVERLIN
jgi:hypothetical protein